MSTVGTRGKYAEKETAAMLKKLGSSASFVSYRLPDARSGSFQATLADFLVVFEGIPLLLEVKQVAHDFRLNYNNFNSSQVARQRLWKLAGSISLVLVFHSTTKMWRCLEIESFLDRSVGGSWDLRNHPEGLIDEVFSCQLKLQFQNRERSTPSGLLTLR